MKKSKVIILFITLSFPVILYLFLRSYGHNEYDLPVFFEHRSDSTLCNDSNLDTGAVTVFDFGANSFTLNEVYQADYKVIHFPNEKDSNRKSLENELNRVIHTFSDAAINVLSFAPWQDMPDSTIVRVPFLSVQKATTYLYKPEVKEHFVNCIYVLPTEDWNGKHPSELTITVDHTLVLLDEMNRIRGYYDGYDTKDVDRLIMEIRVLLSNK